MIKKSAAIMMTMASLYGAAPVVMTSAVIATTVAVAPAHAGKLETAVYKAVVQKKQTKKVKASGGHEFNIKPIKVTPTHRGYSVSGQLSHHLRWRTDDQYYFTIQIDRNGTILDLKEKVNRGGLTSMVIKLPVGELLSAKSGGIVDSKTADAAIKKSGGWIGRKIDGKWEKAAREIVVMVGLQVAQQRRLGPNF